MACNSLQSTKAHLMEYGLIDKDNNKIELLALKLNLDIKKFKTANYLPSLILAPIFIKIIPPAIDWFINILA